MTQKAPADMQLLLRRQREEILSLPSEKAVDRILEEKHPAALVHSFAEEDFYFLLQDIGLADALPLLALASDRQREYIVDMAGWDRDRLDPNAVVPWLSSMFLADPTRTATWLLKEQTDLLEFLFFRNLQVISREHDEDPSDFGDGFATVDDVFYFRILDDAAFSGMTEGEDAKIPEDHRQDFFASLLAKLADMDHLAYQRVLIESTSILPAETEEELYRLRSVRLSEKGFFPFEEAIGVYQPVTREALAAQTPKSFGRSREAQESAPLFLYPAKMLQKRGAFATALAELEAGSLLDRIQQEFASLCNQVIAADRQKIEAKSDLQTAVEKVRGYLDIGLEAWDAGAEGKPAALLIRELPLSQLFRFGYGQALSLKWKAQAWLKTAWSQGAGLPLTFWGEKWLGALGGLLVERPLFFDDYRTVPTLYREFTSLTDIRETETVLSAIMAMDRFLAELDIPCRGEDSRLMTWQNLLLTLFAHHELGSADAVKEGKLRPVALPKFRELFQTWFGTGTPAAGKTAAAIKTRFLVWLSDRSGKPAREITDTMGPVLDELFGQVDSELGGMSPETLDPRFTHLFRIS